MKFFDKIRRAWLFRMANPIVREGEAGGFRWKFRRYWLEIETLSQNFSARYMADEHPYAYLLASEGDDNIHGFCQTVYYVAKTVTTDQELVNDIGLAFRHYNDRLEKAATEAVVEDEAEEQIAIEEVKQVYEKARDPKTGRFVKRLAESK